MCHREITYSAKREKIDADKNNSKCNYCKIKGRRCTESTRQKLRENNLGKTHSEESRKKRSRPGSSNPMYGKRHSEETREKIKNGIKNRIKKPHSIETKTKMRLSRITALNTRIGQIMPNYNPAACRLIDEYGKLHDYSFQHAENGGEFHIIELGYWVDGYDKEKNVVIEIDEPYHRRQQEKDTERQRLIVEHLKCKFIRLNIS